MFRCYLLSLLLVVSYGQQFQVKIQYQEPQLTLSVRVTGNDVTGVSFRYSVGSHNHNGRGTKSSEDYVLHTQLRTNPGENIHASAEIHYSSGLTITTPQATQHVGGASVVPLGGRRIRAVTFRDDFNNYNQNNWHPEISMWGGGNWEFQVYTPEARNIYANGGHLYLRPTLTTDDPNFSGNNFLHTGVMDVAKLWGKCTNSANYGCSRDGHNGLLSPIMSGKVSSGPTTRFGTVEVRARIPRGDWIWPAIWMMPRDSKYGGWPRSGEIDIMESRGNAGDIGVGEVSSTLHWGPGPDQNRFSLTHGEKHGAGYHADFHTWRLDWTESHLKTFIDNQQILDVEVGNGFWAKGGFSGANIWGGGTKAAPFDQPFFLMLNVAIGGTNGYFPETANYAHKKPWANNSPHAAEDFWNARSSWLPTWQGDNVALVVDYVQFSN